MVILICVREKDIAEQICIELNKLQIDAEIFHYFRNPTVSCLSPYLELLPLAPVIMEKDKIKGQCSIIDIEGDGKNYISLGGGFGSKCLEYYVANMRLHKNQGDSLESVDKEAVGLLRRADICLLEDYNTVLSHLLIC